MADESVRLPGTAPGDTYLCVDAVVDAARRTGADAIHPGYGFLSENAAFARACADAGIVFVGPPPAVIERMGSKIEAKLLMEAAGVPVLPGATVGPDDPVDALHEAAGEIGFPLLVKASLGGGGRGMRIVDDPADLATAVDGAQREAASAFGDGAVFIERYVEQPAPRRDPGPRRHAGRRRAPVRAGMLDPAPLPEDRRGGTVDRDRRRAAATACVRRLSPPRGRSAT